MHRSKAGILNPSRQSVGLWMYDDLMGQTVWFALQVMITVNLDRSG